MINFSLQKMLHAGDGEMRLDVNCEIENGAFISLYGPSGAGKTSLIRMLAGFMKPDSGFIKVEDKIWFDSENKINIAPQHRLAGFVFQDYALFPNMNVEENISFALSKNESKKMVNDLMEVTGLTGLRDKKIQLLSGGQQQRVALARALVRKPQLLLLDEPLSAIDIEMRSKLQETLMAIHSVYKITSIIVSHDINEIVKLTSKTIHLTLGRMLQYSEPTEIFLDKFYEPSSFHGIFLSAEKNETGYIFLVLAGNQLIKIVGTENDCKMLQKGDRIIVSFKDATAFLRKL
jgi:molybdate transport system ATP-binding protein